MDVKEKLVELLQSAPTDIMGNHGVGALADYLIDNGVTVQEWISVDDRLPIEESKAHEQEWCEEYPEFIVMIERGWVPTTLYFDLENNKWFRINTALKREEYKVTHWMPLPEPPKGE